MIRGSKMTVTQGTLPAAHHDAGRRVGWRRTGSPAPSPQPGGFAGACGPAPRRRKQPGPCRCPASTSARRRRSGTDRCVSPARRMPDMRNVAQRGVDIGNAVVDRPAAAAASPTSPLRCGASTPAAGGLEDRSAPTARSNRWLTRPERLHRRGRPRAGPGCRRGIVGAARTRAGPPTGQAGDVRFPEHAARTVKLIAEVMKTEHRRFRHGAGRCHPAPDNVPWDVRWTSCCGQGAGQPQGNVIQGAAGRDRQSEQDKADARLAIEEREMVPSTSRSTTATGRRSPSADRCKGTGAGGSGGSGSGNNKAGFLSHVGIVNCRTNTLVIIPHPKSGRQSEPRPSGRPVVIEAAS